MLLLCDLGAWPWHSCDSTIHFWVGTCLDDELLEGITYALHFFGEKKKKCFNSSSYVINTRIIYFEIFKSYRSIQSNIMTFHIGVQQWFVD